MILTLTRREKRNMRRSVKSFYWEKVPEDEPELQESPQGFCERGNVVNHEGFHRRGFENKIGGVLR